MKIGHGSVGQLAKLDKSHWEYCVLLQPGLEASDASFLRAWHLRWIPSPVAGT